MFALIDQLLPVLKQAGDKILEIYHQEDLFNQIDAKVDDSPLTLADTESNLIIENYLSNYFTYPIVSEEGEGISYAQRKNFKRFWLVDPLDGTKEFVNRNGEFTVNIALIEGNTSIFGAIYVPVTDTYYFGGAAIGAYKKVGTGPLEKIKVAIQDNQCIAVGSKSHAKPAEQAYYSKIGATEVVSVGSSLKFCLIAEGKAQVYFRSGPTMEWDTAAGQAIAEGAGAFVFKDLHGEQIFGYNKENLLNGAFLCTADKSLILANDN